MQETKLDTCGENQLCLTPAFSAETWELSPSCCVACWLCHQQGMFGWPGFWPPSWKARFANALLLACHVLKLVVASCCGYSQIPPPTHPPLPSR